MMANRYGSGGAGIGRRINDEDAPLDEPDAVSKAFTPADAGRLRRAFARRGDEELARRADQVGERMRRSKQGQAAELSANSMRRMESTRLEAPKAARRRGKGYLDTTDEIERRAALARLGLDGRGRISKLRRDYDPQDRRMRRMGNYEAASALGGTAAGAAGVHGTMKDTKKLRRTSTKGEKGLFTTLGEQAKVKGSPKPIALSRRNAALMAAGGLGIAGAGAIHGYANNNAGRRWS